MKGILFAIAGGALITLQGAFNVKLSNDIGIWPTSIITHFIGFMIAIAFYIIKKDGYLSELKNINKIYLTPGTFGAIIVFSETFSIHSIGITFTVGTLMIAQLLSAFLIEMKGYFDVNKTGLNRHHIIGILVMVSGIVVFNW
ncbi:DMT family transporter [Bacillus sp. JJ722]|uniref:DMT family transporter n=1 Tax=Bacillus sp. JJ722 TaxID=3122973 RepID=UPI0030000172